jgi:hypothetical protein
LNKVEKDFVQMAYNQMRPQAERDVRGAMLLEKSPNSKTSKFPARKSPKKFEKWRLLSRDARRNSRFFSAAAGRRRQYRQQSANAQSGRSLGQSTRKSPTANGLTNRRKS